MGSDDEEDIEMVERERRFCFQVVRHSLYETLFSVIMVMESIDVFYDHNCIIP